MTMKHSNCIKVLCVLYLLWLHYYLVFICSMSQHWGQNIVHNEPMRAVTKEAQNSEPHLWQAITNWCSMPTLYSLPIEMWIGNSTTVNCNQELLSVQLPIQTQSLYMVVTLPLGHDNIYVYFLHTVTSQLSCNHSQRNHNNDKTNVVDYITYTTSVDVYNSEIH
jgi:hypothetical protein